MKSIKILMAVVACMLLINVATPVLASDAVTITGTVESMDDGFVILAADADYKVEGMDVSGMVGKEVKATGTVTESEGTKTIAVTAVEEVTE